MIIISKLSLWVFYDLRVMRYNLNDIEASDKPSCPSKKHSIIIKKTRSEVGMPILWIVLLFQYSKLILLYSSQFGIYVMPQLDTIDSTLASI